MCLSFVVVITLLALSFHPAEAAFSVANPAASWRRSTKQRRLAAQATVPSCCDQGQPKLRSDDSEVVGPMDTIKFAGLIVSYMAFFYAAAASPSSLQGRTGVAH